MGPGDAGARLLDGLYAPVLNRALHRLARARSYFHPRMPHTMGHGDC